MATLGGPPLGGVLVEWVSWRWIFFINLPLAVAALVLAHRGRCPPARRAPRRPARRARCGARRARPSACSRTGWSTAPRTASAARGGRSWSRRRRSAAFVVVERRVAEPMLPFALFRRRNFAVANLETFLVYGALGGVFFFFTIYLQFLGFSPLEAGLANVPGSIVMILLSPRFGTARGRARAAAASSPSGPMLIAAGHGAVLVHAQQGRLLARRRAGARSSSPSGCRWSSRRSRRRRCRRRRSGFSGIASGLNQTFSRLGNLLTVAVLGLVVLLVYHANGGDHGEPLARDQHDAVLRSASMDAFRVAMLVSAGLALAGAVVAASASRTGTRPQRRDEPDRSTAS